MSTATPDQKGAAAPTSPAPDAQPAATDATPAAPAATEDATPNRILNANAKSFVPRLETAANATATSPAKGNRKPKNADTNSPSKQQHQQQQQQQQQQQLQQQQMQQQMPQQMQMPMPQLPPFAQPQFAAMYPPPIAPLTAMAGVTGFPGFNPMLMSPLVVAALAASGRGVPPSPFAMAAPSLNAATPGSPMVAPPPSSVVPVNVGNASLQALRATGPARFACVLLVGMPRVGKTTIGRNLVSQLEADNLQWAFFSGGDYLRDTPTRPAPWDTTKDVYDALSHKIDELQAKAVADKHCNIKGLIIDKQCRGTEELYYLTALLRSKGLQLNGVVGLVADDDTRLMERLGETDVSFREKCKFHRVIQTRIREASKSAGLWHAVDALEPQDEVVRRVRSMVLGCSSQQPHKQLSAQNYHESISMMVDNYETYARVMGELTKLSRMPKASQFPGFTNFTPLPQQLLNKKSAFKEYFVRRRSDGTKYLLLFEGQQMYLVPRHMRCVFHLKNEAWLGSPLSNVANFVLDGDVVRLSKERGKEKFLVQDVLCWHEKGNATTNLVSRLSWKERQDKLKMSICGEQSAFYSNCDIVVAQQTFVEFKNAADLLEPCDYATDGFVFQPAQKRDDPVYFWRSPENVTVDFRLGPGAPTGEGSKKYTLQVFDQKQAKFIEYGTDSVTVQENRQFVVEGALVVCTLKPEEAEKTDGREWSYVRTRTDIPTAAFKSYVDDLLSNCLIPKASILTFLGVDPNAPRPAAAAGAATAAPTTLQAATSGTIAPLGTTAHNAAGNAPQFGGAQQPPMPGSTSYQSRGAFGSALTAADAVRMSQQTAPLGAAAPQSTLADLQQVIRTGNIHTVSNNDNAQQGRQQGDRGVRRDTRPPREEGGDRNTRRDSRDAGAAVSAGRKDRGPLKRHCADCGKLAEGEHDVGNHLFYCFSCWEVFESKDQPRNKGRPAQNGDRNTTERKERGPREPREHREPREPREAREPRGERKPREPREPREGGDAKEGEQRNQRRPRKQETPAAEGATPTAEGETAETAKKEPRRRRNSTKGEKKDGEEGKKSSPVADSPKQPEPKPDAAPVAVAATA